MSSLICVSVNKVNQYGCIGALLILTLEYSSSLRELLMSLCTSSLENSVLSALQKYNLNFNTYQS